MAKRIPCGNSSNWTTLILGECGQHLKTGESPVVKGMGITYRGAPYKNPPAAIISGMNGYGFYGYGILGDNNYVNGLEIISSGWHITSSPTIIFSGIFDERDSNCFGKQWNDTNCMCSGTGNILGFPIYENKTLLPPQCSPLLLTDWTKNKSLPICSSDDLKNIQRDGFGNCPSNAPSCITSLDSGWVDCLDGGYKKTNNYCYKHGDRTPYILCAGPWYASSQAVDCNEKINQTWEKTNNFLDVGVCKKKGYKDVIAMKSWHGQPPLTVCSDGKGIIGAEGECLSGEQAYTVKYRTSDGLYSFDMNYSNDNDSYDIHTNGYINYKVAINATVGRFDGKVTVNENVFYDSKNWQNERNPSLGFGGVSACSGSCIGPVMQEDGTTGTGLMPCIGSCYNYPLTGWDGYPWNYIQQRYISDTNQYWSKVVTSVVATEDGYTFSQEITTIDDRRSSRSGKYKYHSLETVVVALSDPYTYQEVNDDLGTLADKWNLLDDLRYPWKTDNSQYYNIPKVTFCEAGPTTPYGLSENHQPICPTGSCNYLYSNDFGTVTWNNCEIKPDFPQPPDSFTGDYKITTKETCSWNTLYYINDSFNGDILGAPAEIGKFGTVDFSRLNYKEQCCSCRCDTFDSLILDSFGDTSKFYHITQWPNLMEMQNVYFGAFKLVNDFHPMKITCASTEVPWIGKDIFVAGKYAEIILLDKPSLNSGMPCGIGSSLEMILQNETDDELNAFVDSTFKTNCEQTGNFSNNGYCRGCDSQETGKLRWKYLSGLPFICGNMANIISGASDGFNLNIVLNAQYTGSVGDYINISLGIDSNYYSGAYKIVDVLSSSGLNITGNFIISNNVIGWIDFPRINDKYDNYPKGDFIVRQWNTPTMTGISNYFYDFSIPSSSAYCTNYQICDPSIVVITTANSIENQNNTRNATIIEMPSLVPKPCGAKMNYLPQQWMTDPTWNKPSKPCCLVSGFDRPECNNGNSDSQNHTWEEDNGTCQESVIEYTENGGIINHHYYPSRPYVEALPTTLSLPTVPLGYNNCNIFNNILLTVGKCYSNSELSTLTASQIKALEYLYGTKFCPICEPPSKGDNYLYWDKYAPWIISQNQKNCIDNS